MLLLESLPTVIGAAAIAPALLVLWLVIAADERPGPPVQVWLAFVLGAASISLLGLARIPFNALLAIPDNPWATQAVRALFGVAAPEEIVKVFVIVAISTRRRAFADPMDTVVYGAAAGLGFAAYENLAYLVQHKDMWRALAALRSVLTVPFHGALGIIAGAYLAIARSGGALGAYRGHRDWARITNWALVLVAPVLLHAAFDFPLLALQRIPDLSSTTHLLLGTASVLIGFSSIGFAVRLVRRLGRHHAPRTDVARERLSQLRRMWALLLIGGGTGFAGVAFLLTSLHHWYVNPERNASFILIPIGFTSILIGLALLVATTAVYFFGPQPDADRLGRLSVRAGPGLGYLRSQIGRAAMTLSNDLDKLRSEMKAAVKAHWKAFLFEGILLVILGIAALIVPTFASLAVTIFLGWMFLISGIGGLIVTFWARSMPGFWWSLISATLAVLAGMVLLARPMQGVLTLTIVTGAYFVAEGIATIMYALEHRRELSGRWSWLLIAGLMDILVAFFIIAGLPESAGWAIGLLVGLNLMFGGATLIGMALAARNT